MKTLTTIDTTSGTVETRTIHKMRIRILPLIFLLYIVAFLDRINIGFAALTMNAALGVTSTQFGLLSGMFFLGYFLFELPSNLVLHKVGARIWIARILVSWGMVAVVTGFVRSTPQLYAARFLLGVAEAGFFPGILLYLTYWFRQREQAQVLALFIAAAPVSGILGAPVSGFILDHVHWLAVSSWRWLLILEGLPAIVCGVLTIYLLPSRPAEATFLTRDEKSWITQELAREEKEKATAYSMSALRALSNRRVWHLALMSFAFQIGVYSMYFWMPKAVKSLSSLYTNTAVGTMVMIPYLAGLTAMILVSRSSDRRLERRYHGAIPLIVAGIALMLLGTTGVPWVSITLWSVVAMGISSFNGPFWSLPNEFLAGASAASGIALITSIGSLGGFVGPFALGWITQRTGSLYTGLALAGASLFGCAALMLVLSKKARVSKER